MLVGWLYWALKLRYWGLGCDVRTIWPLCGILVAITCNTWFKFTWGWVTKFCSALTSRFSTSVVGCWVGVMTSCLTFCEIFTDFGYLNWCNILGSPLEARSNNLELRFFVFLKEIFEFYLLSTFSSVLVDVVVKYCYCSNSQKWHKLRKSEKHKRGALLVFHNCRHWQNQSKKAHNHNLRQPQKTFNPSYDIFNPQQNGLWFWASTFWIHVKYVPQCWY